MYSKLVFTLFIAGFGFISKLSAQSPYPNSGDQNVFLNDTQPYGVKPDSGSIYTWSIEPITGGKGTITPGISTNLVMINWTNAGKAYLKVVEKNSHGCEGDTTKIVVTINPKSTKINIFIPNAFTPNNDGINDIFKPILTGINEIKYFMVYNRYGQVVFKTSAKGEGWNGYYHGRLQNIGNYTWILEAIDIEGRIIKKWGSVLLLK